MSGARLLPGLLSRLAAAEWLPTPHSTAGLALPACCQPGWCLHDTQTCTGCSCQALDQMCQPGGAGGEGETPAVGQRALAARGTSGPTSWRDRDVYKARLKHLHSPKKQESIMDARACRGQGRREVRWLHPEVRAGGAGDTELSCFLEERAGMVLLGSVHREKRGALLQCV